MVLEKHINANNYEYMYLENQVAIVPLDETM